jgi:predicted NUDIX family phosphoesterase
MKPDVLCFDINRLAEEFKQTTCIKKLESCQLQPLLLTWKPYFTPRIKAETDVTKKQIIPYVILRDSQQRYGVYKRKSSEKRLLNLFTLGFGGHIDEHDYKDHDWQVTILCSLQRELAEEAGIKNAQPELLGLVNEEQTKVGHTHIAIVYMLNNVDSKQLQVSTEISALQWVNAEDLKKMISREHFELWSVLAYDLLLSL